jgi:hypothetical protein
LPGTLRITEVHFHIRGHREVFVLGHLQSAVPRQRASQGRGKFTNVFAQCPHHFHRISVGYLALPAQPVDATPLLISSADNTSPREPLCRAEFNQSLARVVFRFIQRSRGPPFPQRCDHDVGSAGGRWFFGGSVLRSRFNCPTLARHAFAGIRANYCGVFGAGCSLCG